jgi:integrase
MRRGDGKGRVFRRPRSRSLWIAYCGPRRDGDGGTAWGEIRESANTEDETKAARLLRKRLREVSNDREGLQRFRGAAGERVTLTELLDGLETSFELRGKKSLPQLRSHMKHVRGYFQNAKAADVTTASVRDYVAGRKEQGAANSTCNHESKAIGQAFALAVEDGRIAFAPKMPKSLSERDGIREVRFSPEQADAIAAAFQKWGDLDAFDFWTWMRVSGGMRPSAITALTWDSLDCDSWTLRLPARDDKSGYGRPIPLEGETRKVIERRMNGRRPGVPWIFHYQGRKLTTDYFRKFVLYPVLKELGLPAGRAGFYLYDLKRTGMLEVRSAGVPEDLAMRLSGHRTKETYRRYAYGDADDLRAELRRVDDYRAERRTSRAIGGTLRTFQANISDTRKPETQLTH